MPATGSGSIRSTTIFGHMHYARDCAADGLRVVLLGAWDAPACAVLDDAGKLKLKRL